MDWESRLCSLVLNSVKNPCGAVRIYFALCLVCGSTWSAYAQNTRGDGDAILSVPCSGVMP